MALVTVAVLLATACGSRRTETEIAAANAGGSAVASATDGSGLEATAAGETGETGGSVAVEQPVDHASDGPGAPAAGQAGPSATGGTTAPVTSSAGLPASSEPIRIGTVGTTSGLGGTQRTAVVALQAWVQKTNDAGGINGHPVELYAVDDGGDPARHRAALQELVEQRQVTAFVNNLSALTLTEGAIKYLESKRVPVVGGDRLEELWYSSPMMFPQGPAGHATLWVVMADLAKTMRDRGMTRLGMITCQELQMCRDQERFFSQWAPKFGIELVYTGIVSLAQPDFTSECLQAQQRGVEYLTIGLDANSTRRIAASCRRQGFEPAFGMVQTSGEMVSEPALDGANYASRQLPFMADDTPAAKEFQAAMRQYAPGVTLSDHAASGWVAAKLLERALRDLQGQPTSEKVLEGLWSIKGEDLGGITAPLTFERDRPAQRTYCWFRMRIMNGRWTAPEGSTLLCEPPR